MRIFHNRPLSLACILFALTAVLFSEAWLPVRLIAAGVALLLLVCFLALRRTNRFTVCLCLFFILLSLLSSSFFFLFVFFNRPLLRSASAIIHWSWPLVERNSSAAHASMAFMVSASMRSTKLLVVDSFFTLSSY